MLTIEMNTTLITINTNADVSNNPNDKYSMYKIDYRTKTLSGDAAHKIWSNRHNQ